MYWNGRRPSEEGAGVPPPPPDPPPQTQRDHRGKQRSLALGRCGRAIVGTPIFGVPSPPLPPLAPFYILPFGGGSAPPPPSPIPKAHSSACRAPALPPSPPPPPQTQRDHRGKQQSLALGRSGGAIVGTPTFGSQTPFEYLPCPPPRAGPAHRRAAVDVPPRGPPAVPLRRLLAVGGVACAFAVPRGAPRGGLAAPAKPPEPDRRRVPGAVQSPRPQRCGVGVGRTCRQGN